MRGQLTPIEKDVLTYCMDQTSLPIVLPSKIETSPEATPEKIKEAADNLKRLGMVNRDKICTNRGLAALVVECGFPFSKFYREHPEDFSVMKPEFDHKTKTLGSENYFDIYQYYYLKLHIDLDLFNGPPNHEFKILYAQSPVAIKMNLDLCLALIDDGRIPLQNILNTFGFPPGIMKETGIDAKGIREHIIRTKGMY